MKKLDQLSELQQTMNFMSRQYDDILKNVAENRKQLEVIKKENKNLKSEIKTLKDSVKYLNDQRVKYDCLVTGVKVAKDASAVETILKLASDAGVELQAASVDDAYVLKNKRSSSDKQNVVVKFNSRESKQTMMSLKKKLPENEATKSVYVQDFLSRETLSLLNYAKSLKNVGYRAVYAVGGRIYTKRSELSKPRPIADADEVDKLLLEASTHKQSNNARLRNISGTAEESDDAYQSSS